MRYLARAVALSLVLSTLVWGQKAPLLSILAEELDRNYRVLREKPDPKAYFLAYSVTELEIDAFNASFGALQNSARSHQRYLDVTLRLGSPKLDNYHRMQGDPAQFTSGAQISLDDVPAAIKQRAWLETDRIYRLASQRLIRLQTNTSIKVAAEDDSPDFSPAEPTVFEEPPPKLKFSAPEWIERLRRWSAEFHKYPAVFAGGVSLTVQRETKYLVNTEGARLQHGRTSATIVISARGRSTDGMELVTVETLDAADPGRLPKDDIVKAAVERVAKILSALRNAPVVDPFVGPAILSGRAAGVFFHEIFGHRIEGHRQKDDTEGQTFTKRIGQPVLPEFLSVYADPTRRNAAGADLNGYYLYDDEGVKARQVKLVDRGILKTFLLTRSPISGFPESNGHGRRQPGAEVVSRQSNLIVDSGRAIAEKELREMLITEIKRQQKPYGLYFKEVTGGFTTTGRRGLQAFTVIPLVVYRVYPDGRPDELVRGADIVGTPLASFARIIATSDTPGVFNGVCGAESGQVPVSAVSPALLVSEIEVQKKAKSDDQPPLLPRPQPTGGAQ